MAKKAENTSKEKNTPKKTEEKISLKEKFDFVQFTKIYSKQIMIVLAIVLSLTAVFIGYETRDASVELDGLDQRIEQNIMQNIQQIIIQQLQQQYPNLDEQLLQQRAMREYQEVLETRTFTLQGEEIPIDIAIQQEVDRAKQLFQSDEGQTYLTAIDPYFFYRESTNYYFNDHTGDTLKENDSGELQPFTTLRQTPKGTYGTEEPRFHVWLGAFMFNLHGITEESTHGEKIAAIFTIVSIIAALSAIPAYFLIRRFTNDLYAFFGSLIVVLQSTFVSRTTAGFFDTEAYGVFFPLIVVMLLVFAYFYSNPYVILSLAIGAGIVQGLGQWAWGQNWYILIFLILAFIGHGIYLTIISLLNKHTLKEAITNFKTPSIILGGYLSSSILFTYLFSGNNLLTQTYGGFQSYFTRLVTGADAASVWPNVLSSVAELANASFSDILEAIGGNSLGVGQFILLIGIMGLVFMFCDYKSENKKIKNYLYIGSFIWLLLFIFGGFFEDMTANQLPLFISLLFAPVGFAFFLSVYEKHNSQKVFGAILITIWLASTLFMSFSGVRFIMLLAAPAGIAAAVGLFYIGKAITNFISEEIKVENPIGKMAPAFIMILVLASFIILPMYNHAQAINLSNTPNFDDNWFDSMEHIRENADDNAIITSWWDFGHFFAAIGERGVTFDGASQDTPPAHWVGKLLVEDDPQVSQDILRMLSCGWNDAHERIMEVKGSNDSADEVKSVHLIYDTFGIDKEDKYDVLGDYNYHNFSQDDKEYVMEALHCDEPPQTILITSGDMINKAAVWAHWGLWDFEKKYVADRYNSQTPQEMAQSLDMNLSVVESYVQELQNIDVQARTTASNRQDLLNRWFSPYPGFADSVQCQEQNGIINCAQGVQINASSGAMIDESIQGQRVRTVILSTGEDLIVNEHDENGGIDLVAIPSSQGYEVQLLQAPLGTSLFTELYVLDGVGNTHFEEMYRTSTQTAGEVILWETNWE